MSKTPSSATPLSSTPVSLNPPLCTHSMDLTGRSYVVTGGTQGLGLAVAHRLLQLGAHGLVVVSRSPKKGAAAVQALREQHTAIEDSDNNNNNNNNNVLIEYLSVDLSNADAAATLIETAALKLQGRRIHGVVNAAATTDRGNLFTTTAAMFDAHMHLNARAPFLITQSAARHFRDHSSIRGGSIVNIGSCAAYGGAPFIMAYSASKAALATLTRTHAAELAPHGIRVNAIHMGWCATDHEDEVQRQIHPAGGDWLSHADASVPLGRILRPTDVASSVAFLLSDASAMTTGTVMELHPEFPQGMLSLAATEEEAVR